MLNWGILGLGKIAKVFAHDLSLLSDQQLVAVGSRNQAKADEYSQVYDEVSSYGSYEELLNDKSVDIIYIATPHDSHMEWTIKALDKGKHVLCEKPVGVNQAQVQEMVSAAKRNNKFLMEALWSRFNPTIKEVIHRCRSGHIGAVNHVNAEFNFNSNNVKKERLFDINLAGGALLDVGIYPVFLAYSILGKPKEILSVCHFKNEVDLQSAMIFKYAYGVASLSCGLNSDAENAANISGTKGRFILPTRWHQAQGYEESIQKVRKKFDNPTLGKGYTYEMEECYRCIKNGLIESPDWSHQNSLELISILDEIRDQIGMRYPFE